ncbi:MAG: hypothetical protein LIP01_11775 [Tannerellaceae bacterium]|nr:hypothetical protein [Tannerellaceae bacterium]
MIKTEKQIEEDVYQLVKKSPLAKKVSGNVYRKGMRPKNSEKEDIVVKFLTGLDDQIQTGIVVINIYIPDISVQGYEDPVENIARVAVLQMLVIKMVGSFKSSEYLFEMDTTPQSIPSEDIGEHFIYIRLRYQRLIH